MSLSSLNSIGQTVFELKSEKKNVDGRTDKRTKNVQTKRRNYTNFERNLAMMGLYVPVKFEFDWTNSLRVKVRKEKCGRTDKQTKNVQTKRWNYTNFERNLAMMGLYVPVKYEFDWTKRFQVRVRKEKCGQTDRQTDKKRTNKRTELHQFQKEPSYDGDLSPCQLWIQLDKPFSS